MQIERIGLATLYCGNALEIVPGISGYETVVTDPPYGMEFRSNFRIERYDAIANDGDDSHLKWAASFAPSHSSYIFCRWDNLWSMPKPKSLITWVKNNWSMGDLEHEHGRQTETLLFYPGPEHDFPSGRPNDVIKAPRSGNEHHPTEKPVQVMGMIVEWTRGTVLDMFMGSGSTGVACCRLGREFIGVEQDQTFFDVACRRIEAEQKQMRLFA